MSTIPQRTISNSAGQSDAAETLTKDSGGGLPSRFLAVSFLPALPWLDEFHYVTSRVPAYKEVKDVWKCVRYCILSSLGIPCDSHLRFPPRFCDTCYRLLRIAVLSHDISGIPVCIRWRFLKSSKHRKNIYKLSSNCHINFLINVIQIFLCHQIFDDRIIFCRD